MSGFITVNPGTASSATVFVETPAASPTMPASKIHTGAVDVDGGPMTAANPLFASQVDGSGNVLGTAAHPTATQDAVTRTPYGANATVSAAIKASPGTLYGIYALNNNAAARYLVLWNLTAAGSTLTGQVGCCFLIPANSWISIDQTLLGKNGWAFSTGISWGISTSSTSYVAATAGDHNVAASFA